MITEIERKDLQVLRDLLIASFKGASFAGVEIDNLIPALNKVVEQQKIRTVSVSLLWQFDPTDADRDIITPNGDYESGSSNCITDLNRFTFIETKPNVFVGYFDIQNEERQSIRIFNGDIKDVSKKIILEIITAQPIKTIFGPMNRVDPAEIWVDAYTFPPDGGEFIEREYHHEWVHPECR